MALMRITKMEMKAALKEARRRRKNSACSDIKQEDGNNWFHITCRPSYYLDGRLSDCTCNQSC